MIFTKRYIIVFLGIIQIQTNASIRQKPITRLSTSSIRVQLTKNSQLERLDNSQLSSNGLSFLNHRGSTDSSNTSDLSDIFDETNNSYESDFEEEEEEVVTIAPPKDLEEIDSLKSKYHEEIKKLSTLKAKIETTLKILNRLKKCHPDYHEEEEKDLYDPQNSSDESGLYNEDDGNIQSIRNQAIFEESLKKHLEKKIAFYSEKVSNLTHEESLATSALLKTRKELEKKTQNRTQKKLLGHATIAGTGVVALAALSREEFKSHLTKKNYLTPKEYIKGYASFLIQKIRTEKDKRYLALLLGILAAEIILFTFV